jgi:hypothetical protein
MMTTNREPDPDASWARRAALGDQGAWAEILSAHRQRLRRIVALRLDPRLKGRIYPSDVIQEAYIAATAGLREYVERAEIPVFLWLRWMAGAKLDELHRKHLGFQIRNAGREDQVVSSDRFKSHDWLWAYWRQVCWGHLRRDFQAMIDRGGPGEGIGRRLLGLSDRLFGAWHQARDDALEEWAFQQRILRLRPRVRRALEDGTRCGCATARTCAEILRVEEGLWNFVWFPGVEPTNNAAERALRHAASARRVLG